MTEEQNLRAALDALGLPPSPTEYLCELYNSFQVFDDAYDRDEANKKDVERAVWWSFVGQAANDFYSQKSAELTPVVAVQILKWRAANEAEEAGRADAQSYMHRAGFYDIVMLVCHLCGVEASHDTVLRLYGETFEDYKKEFS